jgi:hypothetical protein
MTKIPCSRCPDPDVGLKLDGPLTVRLCRNCFEAWLRSKERKKILELVGDFIGKEHPTVHI